MLMNTTISPKTEVFFVRASTPLAAPAAGSLHGRRIVFALAHAGHAVQETLVPARTLAAAGAEIVFASIGSRSVHFDPVCNALAVAEALYSPALAELFAA